MQQRQRNNSRPSSNASIRGPNGKPSLKEGLQTAVRALKPEELFALNAENERLLALEQKLTEREAALLLREAQLGNNGPPPQTTTAVADTDFAKEENARLQAQNKELRKQLDLAMLGGGGGGVMVDAAQNDELRRRLHELEAQRVLERSEERARLEASEIENRNLRQGLNETAARLDEAEKGHAHAGQLLADLQKRFDNAKKKLDEVDALRSAAERERDTLAHLLAQNLKGGEAAVAAAASAAQSASAAAAATTSAVANTSAVAESIAAEGEVRLQVLLTELSDHEGALEELNTLKEWAHERAVEQMMEEHAYALEEKENELHKAVEAFHVSSFECRAALTGQNVLQRELAKMEEESVKAAERAEVEAAKLRAHGTRQQREKERAEARAAQLEAALAEANGRLQAERAASERSAAALETLAQLEAALAAAKAEAQASAEEADKLKAELGVRDAKHEKAMEELREKHKDGLRARERVLKEAVEREKAARVEIDELREQLEALNGDEERARDGEEIALSQVARLEKQLAAVRKELSRREDQLQATTRRLEVLAGASTEAHMHDMGYWAERGKRTEFAKAAAAKTNTGEAKAAAAAAMRTKVIGGAARRPSLDPAKENSKESQQQTTALPPLGPVKIS